MKQIKYSFMFFVLLLFAIGVLFSLGSCSNKAPQEIPSGVDTTKEESIENIDERMTKLSEVENNYYNVKDFGAVGDGQTDDTAAVKEAVRRAYQRNGTAYFPSGNYIISETITIDRDVSIKGDKGSRIIGSERLNGDMFQHNSMYVDFYMIDLKLEHKGQGRIINAVAVSIYNCEFTAPEENLSSLLLIQGSYCEIRDSKFQIRNSEIYGIEYCSEESLSINNTITGNEFTGIGNGLLIGNGEYMEYGRCEGLTVSNNVFRNTGQSQIVIQEIMQVNIRDNSMADSENAIIVHAIGYGTNGIFINNNKISAQETCIKVENSAYILDVSNNVFEGGTYGIKAVDINVGFIRDNIFNGQRHALYIEDSRDLLESSNEIK